MSLSNAMSKIDRAIKSADLLKSYGYKTFNAMLKHYFWNPCKNKYCRRKN